MFEELGETLFWLYALWEANGKPESPPMTAMIWARDRIAHGVIAAEPLEYDDGHGLAMMMPSREGWEWKDPNLVEDIRTTKQRDDIWKRDAYIAEAVGRDLLDPIDRAFDAVGGRTT